MMASQSVSREQPPCDPPMTDLLRQEIATAAHTIVVKVGTRVLTGADGLLNQVRVASLTEELHDLMDAGRKIVLVTSGAVGAGLGRLGLAKRPTTLAKLQAVAAIGQNHLVEAYDRGLRAHGRHAAQILLTAHDLDVRASYLNVRNTIRALLEYGALPIVNENDTVSVDELMTTFGDNDRLAAMVTNLLRAPLLVLLSDVDGLYDGDPRDASSKFVPTVTKLDASILAMVRDRTTGVSKGGMASKLEAARIATGAGENVIIASGRAPGALAGIAAGEVVGTLFLAQGQTLPAFKRWIGFTAQPRGTILIDTGARIRRGTKRQEPTGHRRGGSSRSIPQGRRRGAGRRKWARISARGLTNYSFDEVTKIKGQRTENIAPTFGPLPV